MSSKPRVPNSIPPTTQTPIVRLPLVPTPEANIRGSIPIIIVIEVIRIGRRRTLALRSAALLTAYNNAATDSIKVDLQSGLLEVMSRGRQVPGGACGYMGACGAAISTGIFMSVVTRNTPLSTETWQLCNLMTARTLEQVALNGGPRCCMRDSYLSILTAIDFVKEHLGVEMEKPEVKCSRSRINNQCIGKKCPFSPVKDN